MRVDFYIILNNYREVYQSFQKALQGTRILQYGHGIEIRNINQQILPITICYTNYHNLAKHTLSFTARILSPTDNPPCLQNQTKISSTFLVVRKENKFHNQDMFLVITQQSSSCYPEHYKEILHLTVFSSPFSLNLISVSTGIFFLNCSYSFVFFLI